MNTKRYQIIFDSVSNKVIALDLTDDQALDLTAEVKSGNICTADDLIDWVVSQDGGNVTEDDVYGWDYSTHEDTGKLAHLTRLTHGHEILFAPSPRMERLASIRRAYRDGETNLDLNFLWEDAQGNFEESGDGTPVLKEDWFLWKKGEPKSTVMQWFDCNHVMGVEALSARKMIHKPHPHFPETVLERARVRVAEMIFDNRNEFVKYGGLDHLVSQDENLSFTIRNLIQSLFPEK